MTFTLIWISTIPVKFVIIEKRLKFLKYILDETITSMIRQVYVTLKEDSRKEAFVDLVRQGFEEVEIDLTQEDISNILKTIGRNMSMRRLKMHH